MRSQDFACPERVILVITALSEERRSVIPFLRQDTVKPKSDRHGREYIVGDYYPDLNGPPWHVVLPSPTSAGNAKSAAETALSLALNPAFVFMLGVAGGFPNKVSMYDVVVADRVYDVDAAKIDPEGNYIPRPDQHKATAVLLSRAKTLQDMGGWQSLLGHQQPNEPIEVFIEPIAAGSKLVAATGSEEFKRILRDAPRSVAVENEGFGVMQAAHEASVAALVIRGISDLINNRPTDTAPEAYVQPADGRSKSKAARLKDVEPEEVVRPGPDPHKLTAARHAAAFMFALIGRLESLEVAEAARDEDDYVTVKMLWKDLKEITKGRHIALQLMQGSPMRNLEGRHGSVEIEFKTRRLVSAFVYAVSLEKGLFKEMVGVVPDRVDTTIDTSDPDVGRIFTAVRKLAATDPTERQAGEQQIRELAETHEALRIFSDKTIAASRKVAAVQNLESDQKELKGDKRIAFPIPEPLKHQIERLAATNGGSKGRVVRDLIESAVEHLKTSKVGLRGFVGKVENPRSRLTAVVPSELMSDLDQIATRENIPTRSALFSGLVGYAIEMRTGTMSVSDEKRRLGAFVIDVKLLDDLVGLGELTTSRIARKANVSTETVRRARQGVPVSKTKAIVILRAISDLTGVKMDVDQYLKDA